MWHLTPRPTRRPTLILLTLLAVAALAAACASGGASVPLDRQSAGDDTLGGFQPPAEGPVATAGPAHRRGDGSAARDETLVVKTGTLDLEVKDFDASLARARTAIIGLGGYIRGSPQGVDGGRAGRPGHAPRP